MTLSQAIGEKAIHAAMRGGWTYVLKVYHETPRGQAQRVQTDWLGFCKGGARLSTRWTLDKFSYGYSFSKKIWHSQSVKTAMPVRFLHPGSGRWTLRWSFRCGTACLPQLPFCRLWDWLLEGQHLGCHTYMRYSSSPRYNAKGLPVGRIHIFQLVQSGKKNDLSKEKSFPPE